MTAHFVDLLDALRRRSLRMASLVEDMIEEACEALQECNTELAQRIVVRDQDVDAEEVEVEAEVIRLMALYQPVGADLRLLCTVLKVNNDLERIADCAVNIAERVQHFDPEAVRAQHAETARMSGVIRRILRAAIRAYATQEPEIAKQVFAEEEAADALYGQVIRNVVVAAANAPESIASFLDILSVAKNFERIADHATNVAEDVIYLTSGKIVRHRRDEADT